MILKETTLLSSILCLIWIHITYCRPKYNSSNLQFCDIKAFDSIFNIGHLIYFYRCGQIYTYDPRMNGGQGVLYRDLSALVAARKYCSSDVIEVHKTFYFEFMNLTAFSIQELNCIHRDENSRGMCKRSVREWNHLTFLKCDKWMYAFEYDTQFKPKTNGFHPMDIKFAEEMGWYELNRFFPLITDIAPQKLKFSDKNMSIKYLLFNPIRYFLFLAVKHNEYYCVTYLDMSNMLFNEQNWPIVQENSTRLEWRKGNCFIGDVRGMFFRGNHAFIVGQVLPENRVYDHQVYKMMANGKARVKFTAMTNKIGIDSYEPQTIHRFFGCRSPKTAKIMRNKRSLQETIITSAQKTKTINERLANNLLIRIMVFIFSFILIDKLVGTRLTTRLQNKFF